MDFRFCPDCGSPLSFRELGDEGMVPWCETCDKPWFPMFPVAMIALVYNEKGEVLLLHQDYNLTLPMQPRFGVPQTRRGRRDHRHTRNCRRNRPASRETGFGVHTLVRAQTDAYDRLPGRRHGTAAAHQHGSRLRSLGFPKHAPRPGRKPAWLSRTLSM